MLLEEARMLLVNVLMEPLSLTVPKVAWNSRGLREVHAPVRSVEPEVWQIWKLIGRAKANTALHMKRKTILCCASAIILVCLVAYPIHDPRHTPTKARAVRLHTRNGVRQVSIPLPPKTATSSEVPAQR